MVELPLTHWGRATHICVSELTIMASDNGLSPGRRQAIIWNNAGILSFGLLGTNFSEILIEILTFSFKKMRLKVSSAKWWPFCHGLNVLNNKNHWKTNLVQQPVTTEIHCYFNHFVDVHCRDFILFKCAPNAGLSIGPNCTM